MGWLATLAGAVFGSLFKAISNLLFPPKTAADQRVDDLSATVKEAKDANKIEQKIGGESIVDVDADLAGRVRDPTNL